MPENPSFGGTFCQKEPEQYTYDKTNAMGVYNMERNVLSRVVGRDEVCMQGTSHF